MQAAAHLVQIEPRRQGYRAVKLPVRKLRVTSPLYAFRRFAFSFNDQLIVLHGNPYILLRYARHNDAQEKRVVAPESLYRGAKRILRAGAGHRPARLRRISVEILE